MKEAGYHESHDAILGMLGRVSTSLFSISASLMSASGLKSSTVASYLESMPLKRVLMTLRKLVQISAEAGAQKTESSYILALFQAGQPRGWACPRCKQPGLSARDSSLLVDGVDCEIWCCSKQLARWCCVAAFWAAASFLWLA